MRYEDLTTEMYILNRGVDKLLKYGMDTFELFADETGISFCDRNRIIAKCKIISNKNFMELKCPKRMLNERWWYYTKKLRYSDDKAREIIQQIDDSCESQFIPTNPGLIAKEVF